MIYVLREILDQLYHLHSLIRLKVKFTDIKKYFKTKFSGRIKVYKIKLCG